MVKKTAKGTKMDRQTEIIKKVDELKDKATTEFDRFLIESAFVYGQMHEDIVIQDIIEAIKKGLK